MSPVRIRELRMAMEAAEVYCIVLNEVTVFEETGQVFMSLLISFEESGHSR
jgi:hypothetical protein